MASNRDTNALDDIALLLGEAPEWNSPADFLDDIAAIVARTGRPHPGDQDPDEYAGLLDEWHDLDTGA